MPARRQRTAGERAPGRDVMDEALACSTSTVRQFFLCIHIFEPHAPCGNAQDRRPIDERYDD